MPRGRRIGAVILIVVAIAAAMHAQDIAGPVDTELEKGRQLLQRHEYFDALKAFQRARSVTHRLIRRANHAMSPEHYRVAVGTLVEWLKATGRGCG